MPKQQATQAQISRAISATEKAGFTVYAVEVNGANVKIHTHPVTEAKEADDLEKWFDEN